MGKSQDELAALPSREIGTYQAYRELYGFPGDRLEQTVAIVGCYLGQLLGGKLKPHQLLPSYGEEKHLTGEAAGTALKAWATAWMNKGAK